jgi:8-oxo-dGTP pyrophosphatase MutT (NUDIX family)|tara:strand:- start:1006 stop:1458 length:453 start_codon:yes stop_codon:yes gene_type:complete
LSDIVKTAGGVVIRGKKILFIKKNGRWEFPKGRLKKGANRKKTAIREISEETGLKKKDLNIIKPLIPTHHHNKVSGSILVKETFWFLVQYSGSLKMKLVPEKREGITKCKWFTLDELVLTLKDSRPLVHYLLGFLLNDPVYKNYLKNSKK